MGLGAIKWCTLFVPYSGDGSSLTAAKLQAQALALRAQCIQRPQAEACEVGERRQRQFAFRRWELWATSRIADQIHKTFLHHARWVGRPE